MERTKFSEKVAKELLSSIAVSHWWMYQPQETKPEWNVTTCQDVVHSCFKTMSNLKKLVKKQPLSSEEVQVAYKVIARLYRPFALKWHGVFFDNDSYWADGDVNSKPKEVKIKKEVCEELFDDFKDVLAPGVRSALQIFLPDVDVDNILS